MKKNLYIELAKFAVQLLLSSIVMGALLFISAGTLDYWEAWVFIALFTACSAAISVWLMIKDPKPHENAGPAAKREGMQKIILAISYIGAGILPALDRRFGWSDVPVSVVIFGNIIIALSYFAYYFALRENPYGAATSEVEENHRVISTGPYALVRHPMYTAALTIIFGIPLALGSWWGLPMFIPCIAVIIWHLLNEERSLSETVPGYREFESRVRYRLVPFVW